MKKWIRRWGAAALVMALCLPLLAGCGQAGGDGDEQMNLSVCLGTVPETLDPIQATEVRDETVLEHLYENLMRVSTDTTGATAVTNGVAKSYETTRNNGGTVTYTFTLRNATWSDGQPVTGADFVYAWRRLADPKSQSPNASLLSAVAGYEEVQATGDLTKLQVEAPDETTFAVTLAGDCSWFLSDTCTAAATMPLRQDVVQQLKEAAITANAETVENGGTASATWSSDFTKLVTNGPYLVSQYDGEDALVLTANPKYWGKQIGPTSLTFRFADSPEDAWAMYEEKTVDFVAPLPEEQMEERAKDKNWSATTELSTYTLLYNTSAEIFNDPLARQAFTLSIDRTTLSETASVADSPAVGLVPYGVPESGNGDFRSVGGDLIDLDPADVEENQKKAASLLEQAGYDTQEDFLSLECLYPEDRVSQATADALAEMWEKALGIQVTMTGLADEDLQQMLEDGSYGIAVENVESLIDDAEGFLKNWTSDSQHNVVRYYNSAYNTLLSIINSATDSIARLGCLHDAESLLLEDNPLTPLYFTGTAWQMRENYVGLCRDARGWFSFINVAVAAVA